MNQSTLMHSLRAELARARQQIADLERLLVEAEYRALALERDVQFYRQPAREREYCPKCSKPRDRECPDCGATFPE
jgi:hypothetical protein